MWSSSKRPRDGHFPNPEKTPRWLARGRRSDHLHGMQQHFLIWLRRIAVLGFVAVIGLGLLIARAPERAVPAPDIARPDAAALERLSDQRAADLARLPASADPLRRAEAEAMLADVQRALAELDDAPGAAEAALALYDRAGRRLRQARRPRPDLLGHVELHRGEVLTLLGRSGEALAAYRAAEEVFTAAGRPLMAEIARQRLTPPASR